MVFVFREPGNGTDFLKKTETRMPAPNRPGDAVPYKNTPLFVKVFGYLAPFYHASPPLSRANRQQISLLRIGASVKSAPACVGPERCLFSGRYSSSARSSSRKNSIIWSKIVWI